MAPGNRPLGESTPTLPNLLDGLNIESGERSLNNSFWSSESTVAQNRPASPTPRPAASRSPLSSPSISFSRSQTSTPRRGTATVSESPAVEAETVSSTSQFDPPSLRSIFASGQPTSSVSVNTAQASMSTASPGSGSRPFAALTSASAGRRRDARPTWITSPAGAVHPNTEYTMLGTEKDVDDPTATQQSGLSESLVANTSQAVSNLFVTSAGTTPGQLSREPTYGRRMSTLVSSMNDTSTLAGHLLHLGFEEGRHSDITIEAFGKSYRLHKILLERVPYFSSAFCGPWAESSASEMTLLPEAIDSNITQSAFELAMRRIYGSISPLHEEQEAIGLFATGCWLDMPDLVESCIEHILRQMQPSNLHKHIRLVTSNNYGKAGDRILSSAKAMLCRDGWEMPYEYWDDIPADIVREIIGGDPFYVGSEWERWYLAVKVLNRRLRKLAMEGGLVSSEGRYVCAQPSRLRSTAIRPGRSPKVSKSARADSADDKAWKALYSHLEISPILTLLDEGIHYVHLQFEQLQQIRSQKDILGIPVLPDKVISDALWMSMEIRQRVLGAHEGDLELGLSESADTEEEEDEEQEVLIVRPRSGKGKQREHSQDSSTTETDSRSSPSRDVGPRRFWIPSNDVSCVMGGSREAYSASNFTSPTDVSADPYQRSAATPDITDSAWAADLGSSLFETLSTSRNFVTQSPPRYSQYPPFRFCAEFPSPRTLKERKRVYSQTVWYAGSLWNLYIQRVNAHKNQQLGIYLHRAKDKDPSDDPLSLTVDDRIGQLEREMLMRRGERRSRQWRADAPSTHLPVDQDSEEPQPSSNDYETQLSFAATTTTTSPTTQPRVHKTSQSPTLPRSTSHSTARSTSNDVLPLADIAIAASSPPLRQSATAVSTIPPYTDGRTTIKTYFKIYSPSKGGRLLSVYESAPDSFHFGKSWGWKTSWMVLDDGLDGPRSGAGGVIAGERGGGTGMGSGDGRLRYMVVIGNV